MHFDYLTTEQSNEVEAYIAKQIAAGLSEKAKRRVIAVAKKRADLIEALLDAAFSELQHDTGPTEPEWVHQRSALNSRFWKILSAK